MINLECEAIVTYTCVLDEKDEKKVLEYYENHKYEEEYEFISKEKALSKIINRLYYNNEIEIYNNSTESDFSTTYICVKEIE